MFIKLKDQIVNANTIVEVEKPKLNGIDWWIKASLDLSKTKKESINMSFSDEVDAKNEYDRIVKQLCSDK